jgi:hypothetical protein
MYIFSPLYTPVFWLCHPFSQGISKIDEVTILRARMPPPPPFRHLCALSAGRRDMPHCNNRHFAWQTFFIYSRLITGDHNVKLSIQVQWLLKQEHNTRCVKQLLFRVMSVCRTGLYDAQRIGRIWFQWRDSMWNNVVDRCYLLSALVEISNFHATMLTYKSILAVNGYLKP